MAARTRIATILQSPPRAAHQHLGLHALDVRKGFKCGQPMERLRYIIGTYPRRRWRVMRDFHKSIAGVLDLLATVLCADPVLEADEDQSRRNGQRSALTDGINRAKPSGGLWEPRGHRVTPVNGRATLVQCEHRFGCRHLGIEITNCVIARLSNVGCARLHLWGNSTRVLRKAVYRGHQRR